MSSLALIHATAQLSGALYRRAFPLYAVLYDTYKRVSDRNHIRVIHQLVKPGDRVADVGANIGFYTRLLAQCVGPGGLVRAFEPHPLNFARLRARMRRWPWVEAVEAAVGDRDGTTDLYVSPDLNVDHRTYPTDQSRRRIAVRAVRLDTLLPSLETLDFLKLDIQGAEHAALRGMQAVAARSPDLKLLMELWPFVHDSFGGGTRALLALIESFGFEVRRLYGGGTIGERIRAADWNGVHPPDVYFDVLAVRAGGVT